MTLKRTELVKAAEEMNEVLDLDPQISTGKAAKIDEIIAEIKEAAQVIEEDDEFSDETLAVLKDLGCIEIEEGSSKEEEEAGTDDDPDDDKQEEEKEEDLPTLIAGTAKLAALKDLVNEHDEFKKLRKSLDGYTGIHGPKALKADMMEVLGISSEKASPASSETQKTGKPKKTGEKIAFFTGLIEEGKYTQAQIMEKGQKKYPEASEGGLRTMLTDGKNPKYNRFAKLIVVKADGVLCFKK